MKFKCSFLLAVFSLHAIAAPKGLDLPSCNVQEQRALVAETGGQIIDAGQAHISMRANILGADIGTTRKARKITEHEAVRLFKRVEAVRSQTDRLVKQQGFLSAAEKASFDREFDAVAKQLCK